MNRELLRSESGFTYLAALFILVIMGIMLGMMGETWSMIMRRDREEELLFRGKQIKDAIKRFNENPNHPATSLGDLRFLYEADPRFLERRRYLRKNYLDPVTGKEWQLIKDPAKGIVGVASSSEQEPLKKSNFTLEFKDFEGKTKYRDWQFVNRPPQPGVGQFNRPAVTGLPGSGTPGSGSIGGGTSGGGTTGGSFPGGGTMGSGSIGGRSSGGGTAGGMSSGQTGGQR
jgi:type II secretory pathway pseudopilin PulG